MERLQKQITVTYFHRKPYGDYFSIERLFADIRKQLPSNIACKVATSPFVSRGFLKRIANMLIATLLQRDINHITGDVQYLAFLLRKRKTVLTVPDCVILESSRGIKKGLYLFLWFWLPVKRSAAVTVISQSAKDGLLRYIQCDSKKIKVIHCCVSDDFKPCPKPFNTEKPVVLQVGTRYNKNLLRVAEALKNISCHLRIIGALDNQQLSALSECHIEYSSVAHISHEEIVLEYQKADMLVFVSTYEGFGLPIVEANAVGRPVVTSNMLSMPEVAGNAACMVDPLSVSEIRSGILRIIADESYRKELVENGYRNVKRFESKTIAAQYAALYEDMHQRKR